MDLAGAQQLLGLAQGREVLMKRLAARGLTLVELLVTLAIIALLVLASVPSFNGAIVNSRIRSTGEAVMNGLQMAKSEAVARNSRVRFQLTSSLDGACVVSATGANWVVNVDAAANPVEVEGLCDRPPNDALAPFIIQKRSAATGSGSTQVAATQASLVYNGLGRLADLPPGNVIINLTNPAGGTCAETGGEVVCLRIVVTPVGQARMCNPDPGLPASDPRRC
jgi:type IV fimbrial biogenesis protein FimT